MKSKLLVLVQFIFRIKHACYTCTLRGNDTSRTKYEFATFQYLFHSTTYVGIYVHATAIIEIIPNSNSIINFCRGVRHTTLHTIIGFVCR